MPPPLSRRTLTVFPIPAAFSALGSDLGAPTDAQNLQSAMPTLTARTELPPEPFPVTGTGSSTTYASSGAEAHVTKTKTRMERNVKSGALLDDSTSAASSADLRYSSASQQVYGITPGQSSMLITTAFTDFDGVMESQIARPLFITASTDQNGQAVRPRDSFAGFDRLQTKPLSFTASTSEDGALPSPEMRVPKFDFPDPPTWMIVLLVGCLGAGFAAAALLYLVNFPPSLGWTTSCRRKHAYHKLEDEEYELLDQRGHTWSTINASPTVENDGAATTSADTPTLHRRRRHNDSGADAAATGLGISVLKAEEPALRKQRSFDGCLDKPQSSPSGHSPASSTLRILTAPLPHARTFFHSPLSSAFEPENEDEARYPRPRHRVDLEHGIRGYRGFEHSSKAVLAGSNPSSPKAGFLSRLGDRVEYATDRLARIMHDQVKGDPEEGLLVSSRVEQSTGLGNGKVKKVF